MSYENLINNMKNEKFLHLNLELTYLAKKLDEIKYIFMGTIYRNLNRNSAL